ncbi:MAG: entericidin EcnAB [Pseudomonadota bacterium]
MKTAFKLILATSTLSIFAACNTVQGIGEDITAASKGVEDEITRDRDDDS